MGLGVKGPMAEGRSHICGPLPFAASQPPRNPGSDDVKFQPISTYFNQLQPANKHQGFLNKSFIIAETFFTLAEAEELL